MSMTVEALELIELDAARASGPMLDHYIGLVRTSIVDATQEVAEYATALLPKLQHLARAQRVECINPDGEQDYLAPWITLAEPVRAAA